MRWPTGTPDRHRSRQLSNQAHEPCASRRTPHAAHLGHCPSDTVTAGHPESTTALPSSGATVVCWCANRPRITVPIPHTREHGSWIPSTRVRSGSGRSPSGSPASRRAGSGPTDRTAKDGAPWARKPAPGSWRCATPTPATTWSAPPPTGRSSVSCRPGTWCGGWSRRTATGPSATSSSRRGRTPGTGRTKSSAA